MQNRLTSLALVAAVVVSILALAMFYPPAQATAEKSKNHGNGGNGNDADRVETIDDLFAKVGKKHSGFGGAFINEKKDITYVFLRDGKTKEAKAIANDLEDVLDRNLPNRIKVLHAKYSFLQLKRWHERIDKHIADQPLSKIREVSITDIDDTKNQLIVGVRNAEARAWVEKLLNKLDIPEKAINILRTGRVVVDQPQCANAKSLRDFCRPIVGGLQIETALKGGAECGRGTLGFIAEHGAGVGGGAGDAEDVEGFVTNAHLSDKPTVPDGTVSYQPTCATPQGKEAVQNIIGKETIDPRGISCFRILRCRQSDSNFSALDGGVAEDGLGYIARPALNSTQWNGKDTFRITAEATPMAGDIVTKVGRTTGRTEGEVFLTGVTDFFALFSPPDNPLGVVLQGQVLAGYRAAQGDSGAPVILVPPAPGPNVNPVDATLLGIHHSHVRIPEITGIELSFFSPIQGIETDLGPLNTCAPPIEC